MLPAGMSHNKLLPSTSHRLSAHSETRVMSSEIATKPEIIVVALSIHPHRGSEPGKGWWWACALSSHFRLHLVTQEHSREWCDHQSIVKSDGWSFHTTPIHVTSWKFPTGYRQYLAWLKEVMAVSRQVMEQFPIQGLCHVTLGSFRFLPRYDRLGIPYTIGPLGGGESSPLRITWKRPVPFQDKIKETLRPVINNSFAVLPHLRSCLKSARLVLNTSRETERVVRRMGARRTAVIFPDAYDSPVDVKKVTAQRSLQVDSVKKQIHLLWQGRSLWWKGPDLALLVLRRSLDAGLCVDLTMVSEWDNAFGQGVRELAEKLGLTPHLRFVANMTREKFLELSRDHHGMLATSLHDSGGIPLIEAQALGLPCLTLGLGGHELAACPEAGVSKSPHQIEAFVTRAVDCLTRWQQDPGRWLEESKKGIIFSTQFTITRLAKDVGEFIVPALMKS